MARFQLNIAGEESEVEVTRQGRAFRVTRDGRTTNLQLVHQDGHFLTLEWLLPDGRRQQIRTAGFASGDRRQIWVNGRTFEYERVRRRDGAADSTGALSSSIPAVVTEVLVQAGESVVAGQKLLLLESMKMVIPIQAPYNGRVAAVHCQRGESVPAGVSLIDLVEES